MTSMEYTTEGWRLDATGVPTVENVTIKGDLVKKDPAGWLAHLAEDWDSPEDEVYDNL